MVNTLSGVNGSGPGSTRSCSLSKKSGSYSRKLYLLIATSGAPEKFHRVFDGITKILGPLAERGRINFPTWGAFEGGEPFDLIAFEILETAPAGPFQKPDPGDSGLLHCS